MCGDDYLVLTGLVWDEWQVLGADIDKRDGVVRAKFGVVTRLSWHRSDSHWSTAAMEPAKGGPRGHPGRSSVDLGLRIVKDPCGDSKWEPLKLPTSPTAVTARG